MKRCFTAEGPLLRVWGLETPRWSAPPQETPPSVGCPATQRLLSETPRWAAPPLASYPTHARFTLFTPTPQPPRTPPCKHTPCIQLTGTRQGRGHAGVVWPLICGSTCVCVCVGPAAQDRRTGGESCHAPPPPTASPPRCAAAPANPPPPKKTRVTSSAPRLLRRKPGILAMLQGVLSVCSHASLLPPYAGLLKQRAGLRAGG